MFDSLIVEKPLMDKQPGLWRAEWISPAEPAALGESRPAYLLTRDFVLADTVVESAELCISALGIYEAFLNGVRVGDVELAPGSTNYDATVHAQSYQVGGLLIPGSNRLEVLLSDGWYRGRNGSERLQNSWGTATAAIAQLDIVTSAGETVTLATDRHWTSRTSHITAADLMAGQTTDFSQPLSEPVPVRMGQVSPPSPVFSPAPPVRRIEELSATSTYALSDDATIVDFGQNISGWVRLTNLGPLGSETTLEFGEHVNNDGDLTTDHLDVHSPDGAFIPFSQIDRVVAGTGEEVFEPRHTVHGFRYVRVTHPGRTFDASSATAVVVHTDLRRTGRFSCSDDRLNRLHEAGVWTFRGNAVDVPTDCPTRERLGWTGDFQTFAPTAALLFDIDGFGRKWLEAVRDDQYDSGCLAMYSPDHLRMKRTDDPRRIAGGSAGWGDAAVAVPLALYRQYGDPEILASTWDSARAWVDYALHCARTFRHSDRIQRSSEQSPHEQFVWDGPFHFGEWLEPKAAPAAEVDVATAFQALLAADHGEVGTAFLFRSCSQLSDIAEILGKTDEAASLRDTAAKVGDAWRTEFLRPAGRTALDTQASYVRAINFGLLPDELVPMAANRLVELIAKRHNHLGTGFLSTGLLLPVLADTGHSEAAYSLLTQTDAPSWLGMLERGGTTFWENWDNVDENGTARPGSLNHYSKGAVIGFFYSHVVGLRQTPGSAGWEEFTVRPVIGGGLSSASATLDTVRGHISAGWTLEDGEFTLTVTVPHGIRATAELPGEPVTLLPNGVTTTLRTHITN